MQRHKQKANSTLLIAISYYIWTNKHHVLFYLLMVLLYHLLLYIKWYIIVLFSLHFFFERILFPSKIHILNMISVFFSQTPVYLTFSWEESSGKILSLLRNMIGMREWGSWKPWYQCRQCKVKYWSYFKYQVPYPLMYNTFLSSF